MCAMLLVVRQLLEEPCIALLLPSHSCLTSDMADRPWQDNAVLYMCAGREMLAKQGDLLSVLCLMLTNLAFHLNIAGG